MGKSTFILIAIVFLATILRLYQLGKVPISLEWDEVALGYDAYSILKTGRDQYGQFFPLTFRSLDDYKPPIYEYLTVPSLVLFGLNDFSVRLPSAISGILSVIATYWLVKTLFSLSSTSQRLKHHKLNLTPSKVSVMSLLVAFLLAVSPWHLQFSRAAFEVNISVLITILAVVTFIKGLRKPKLFLVSAFLFGLNLFSYHSARVVGPLLMISLFLLFNRYLPKRRYFFTFFLIFGFFFLNFIPILLSPEAQIRFKATNIFDPGARYLDEKDLPKEFLERRLQDKQAGFELAGRIFHNQRLIYTDYDTLLKAFKNYLSNFGFEYLFIRGDSPLHHTPGFGLLYIVELPFLIIGLVLLIKNLNRYSLLLLFWLFIAVLPNAVTREAPHAIRTLLILPIYQVIIALGLVKVVSLTRKETRWLYLLTMTVIGLLFVVNISYYLHQYYVHTNFDLSKYWMYGRKEAVEFTEQIKRNYDKVLVSLNVDMPHIFWLYYTKYPPEKYLSEGGTVSGGFADERNKFDQYEFRNFDYNTLPQNQRLLLVSTPEDFPPDAKILKTIYYLDGSEALKIAENRR